MRALVVLCHPAPSIYRSFCRAIADGVCENLRGRGYDVTLIDLYRENFDPVLSWEEHQRKTSLVSYVQRHSALVREADTLVIVHPDWWGAPPALLKGWIERVMRSGVAYRYVGAEFERQRAVGLMQGTALVVVATSDGEEGGESHVSLQAVWRNIATFCGFTDFSLAVMHTLSKSTLHQRREFLKRVISHL